MSDSNPLGDGQDPHGGQPNAAAGGMAGIAYPDDLR